MEKTTLAFAKALESITDLKKELLNLPQNRSDENKSLVEAVMGEAEDVLLSAYELAR